MALDSPLPEVVVTGIGVVSPIGIGGGGVTSPFWEALLRGERGIRLLTSRAVAHLPVQFGGEISQFDAKPWIRPRKSLKVMSREIQTAAVAAALAMEEAFPDPATRQLDPQRIGVALGADMLYADLDDLTEVYQQCVEQGQFHLERFGQQFSQRIYPLWMLKYLPNMAACHISIAHDAQGPCNSIASGDVSSLLAILEGARAIQRGTVDVMMTGGSGSRLIVTPAVYRGDLGLSHRNADPAAASRPFDLQRDGMVNGEGGAVLVMERRTHALARGATVYGRFLGGAATCLPRGPATLRQAVRQAIIACLAQTGLNPEQIGHINAHGASKPEDDVAEAQGIADVLPKVPLVAPKANFGNLGAGSGAVELAVSLAAGRHGRLPFHPTYQYPDPACPVMPVRDQPIPTPTGPWLKISWAPSGQVVCLAFET